VGTTSLGRENRENPQRQEQAQYVKFFQILGIHKNQENPQFKEGNLSVRGKVQSMVSFVHLVAHVSGGESNNFEKRGALERGTNSEMEGGGGQ